MPLPHTDVRPADIAAARHRARDLRYNPQRHLDCIPPELVRERAALVRRSEELRGNPGPNRDQRRVVFREIRRVSEQMLACDPWRAARYDQQMQTLAGQWELERLALEREYFYALHAPSVMEELTAALRQKLI